jgi:hypothetical protein
MPPQLASGLLTDDRWQPMVGLCQDFLHIDCFLVITKHVRTLKMSSPVQHLPAARNAFHSIFPFRCLFPHTQLNKRMLQDYVITVNFLCQSYSLRDAEYDLECSTKPTKKSRASGPSYLPDFLYEKLIERSALWLRLERVPPTIND